MQPWSIRRAPNFYGKVLFLRAVVWPAMSSEGRRSRSCTPSANVEVDWDPEESEPASPTGWEPDDDSAQRDAHLVELVLEMVRRYGWVTVNEVATAAMRRAIRDAYSFAGQVAQISREAGRAGPPSRECRLQKRGRERPRLVFLGRSSTSMTEVFDNTCGECVFYSRVNRRCRLWLALSRFNAQQVYEEASRILLGGTRQATQLQQASRTHRYRLRDIHS